MLLSSRKIILLTLFAFCLGPISISITSFAHSAEKKEQVSFVSIMPETSSTSSASGNVFVLRKGNQVHFYGCDGGHCRTLFSSSIPTLSSALHMKPGGMNASTYSHAVNISYEIARYSEMTLGLQETLNAEMEAIEDGLEKIKISPIIGYGAVVIQLVTVAINVAYDDDDLAANRLLQTIIENSLENNRSSVITIKGVSYENLLNVLGYMQMVTELRGNK